MNTRQSFSIDFIIRKCKANKKRADIFARITVDGELPKEISLKEQIEVKEWNSESETVKGRSIQVKAINEHINDVRFRIKEKYRELERNEEIITAETVKAAYVGVQKELKGHKLKELQQFFKKIWEPKLDDFKSYNSIIKYTENYLNSIKPGHDVYLSQVDNEFATNLEHYIRSNPLKKHDPCVGNGLSKMIQRFKRILNWAEDDLK
jgi:integrase/recombinase XerD